MPKLLPASLVLALALPMAADGQQANDPSEEIRQLRQELQSMRRDYEQRLQALEQRLKAAGSGAGAPSAAEPAAAPAAAAAAASPLPPPVIAVTPAPAAAPEAAVAPVPSPTTSAGAFNPAVSLILSGIYTRTTQDPAAYQITGFALPREARAGPGDRGFSLAESELGLAASVDPWVRGAANISLHPDNTVSVEEAFVQTTSLGHGLSLKAGRFFSSIGYLNPQHSHTWDFVDNPLAYQAFLGTQYGDDGVQLTWIAPIDQYVELGLELGRGRSFPGSDTARNGPGMYALVAHTGGDVGDSSSWRAGLSMLHAKADDQDLVATDAGGAVVTNTFTGHTRVWIADGIWKWAPHGNAIHTYFKLQAEYLRSSRDGSLLFDPAVQGGSPGSYRSRQSGGYLQGIYQFMPYWRVGLRTELLDPGNPDYSGNALRAGIVDYRPRKNSLMFDFSPSEFSRVRLQFARDRAREGYQDNELSLQYQMSLGAHGAHSY
jgi:hypothetical protein